MWNGIVWSKKKKKNVEEMEKNVEATKKKNLSRRFENRAV